MLVDSIGDVTITNDGATILKQLEVEHPAAKVGFFLLQEENKERNCKVLNNTPFFFFPLGKKILVELSEMQDQAVGDGTTSVVILASELLKHANNLVRQSLHPTTIISGYRLASKEACKYLKENLSQKTENLGRDTLLNAAKTSMSSKIIGVDSDYFANMLIDAMLSVKTYNDMGDVKYPVKAINILKAHGKSAKESEVLNGYAINVGRAAQGMVKAVQNAKIACLDMNLQKSRMQMGIQVLVSDPKELEKIREEESNITKKRIEKILAAGANVIFTTKGIDDMSLKYFVEAGAIACRRVPKEDLRRIAKCTGATVVSTLADMEGEETFDASNLGQAESVAEERVCDDDIIMVKGAKSTASVTLLLRGANDYMLDEMERSIHDALCVVKRTLEYGSVVAGGGAVEAALSVFLENFAISLGSREQLPVAEFADALMVIPKTLAVNAAKDAIDLVAKLRAYHYTSQMKSGKEKFAEYGLDLYEGAVVNNIEKGVIEPALSKIKILQFATEAAITILRIDDLVQLEKDPSEQQG